MCTDGTFINYSADIFDSNVVTETRDESINAETVC